VLHACAVRFSTASLGLIANTIVWLRRAALAIVIGRGPSDGAAPTLGARNVADDRSAYQGRIVTDPDILVGKPRIRGTRIAVEHVLDQLADTPDIGELFAAFPDLTLADVQACLAYVSALAAGQPVEPRPGPHRRRSRTTHPTG